MVGERERPRSAAALLLLRDRALGNRAIQRKSSATGAAELGSRSHVIHHNPEDATVLPGPGPGPTARHVRAALTVNRTFVI